MKAAKAWGLDEAGWTALPRDERVRKRAQYDAEQYLSAMSQHDHHEKMKAEAKAKGRR